MRGDDCELKGNTFSHSCTPRDPYITVMENLDEKQEKLDNPTTMEEIRLKRLAYFQHLQLNSSSDRKDPIVFHGAKPGNASKEHKDVSSSISVVNETKQKNEVLATSECQSKDLYKEYSSKSDSESTGLKKIASFKITTETDLSSTSLGLSHGKCKDDSQLRVSAKVSKPSESDGLPCISLLRSVRAAKPTAAKWMSSEDVRHPPHSKSSQTIHSSGENQIESLFSTRRWTSANEVSLASLKDSADVDAASAFESTADFEALGLSTHRPDSGVTVENVNVHKQSASLEGLLPGSEAEELRYLLGEQKYREFLEKSQKDLRRLHGQQTLEQSIFSTGMRGECKGKRAKRRDIVIPRNETAAAIQQPETQGYGSRGQSSSPRRRLRSSSPRLASGTLQDITKNNCARDAGIGRNYEQVVVSHNVTFSADEIYRQAYGNSGSRSRDGSVSENELKRSMGSWSLYPDGRTPFWDNVTPQQMSGSFSPASSFGSSVLHQPFVPLTGDQHAYSSFPMYQHVSQFSPFVYPQAPAVIQGMPDSAQDMDPRKSAVFTMLPAALFSPDTHQYLQHPASSESMQNLYSQPRQSLAAAQGAAGSWQHLGHKGEPQTFSIPAPEKSISMDAWCRESARAVAPHPPAKPPGNPHIGCSAGEISSAAEHAVRHVEAVRQHHQHRCESRQESRETAAIQKGLAASSENLLEHYFSSLELTAFQPSPPHQPVDEVETFGIEAETKHEAGDQNNQPLDRIYNSRGPQRDEDSLTMATETNITVETSINAEGITHRMEELGLDPLTLRQLKNQTLSTDLEMLETMKNMVRVCPDCLSVNKEYMTWCLCCGTVLIGVEAVPVTSLKKKGRQKKTVAAETSKCVSRERRKGAGHVGNEFQFMDKGLTVENETRKVKEPSLIEEHDPLLEKQVAKNSQDLGTKESLELGKGGSELSSPDPQTHSQHDEEPKCHCMQVKAGIESMDSGQPSSGDMRDRDEGVASPSLESPHRTEKEINDICEVIGDPIVRGFIKSYLKKQPPQGKSMEVLQPASSQSVPSKGKRVPERENMSGLHDMMLEPLELDLGFSFSSAAEGGKACKHNKFQVLDKASVSQKRSSKKGNEAIDVEIFAIEEARLSRSARCGTNIVPALNLASDSDEEDGLDGKAPMALNNLGDVDASILSSSRSEEDQFKAVRYSAEVKALTTANQGPVDQLGQLRDTSASTSPHPKHSVNKEDQLSKLSLNTKAVRQQPHRKNTRPHSATKVRSSMEAVLQTRHWARSSTAWSSYHPRELRTWSSTNVHQERQGPGLRPKAGNVRGSFSVDDLTSNMRSVNQWPGQKPRPSSADHSSRAPPERRQSGTIQGSRPNSSPLSFPVQRLQHSEQQSGGGDKSTVPADCQAGLGTSSTMLSPRFPETVEHRLPAQGRTLPLIPAGPSTALQIYDRCIELTPRMLDHDLSKWLLLPDEMWLHVCSYLPQKDLAKVACVCKQLYRVAMDETLWKHLTVKKSELCDGWLAQIAQRHPVSLALVHCHGNKVSSEALRELFREVAPYLQELNFSRCSKGLLTGDNILLHASTKCRSLTHVDASWCHVTDNGLSALAECSYRLESLCLNGCQMITDKGLESVVTKHGQSLRVLELFGCFGLTESGFLSLGTHCASLLTLNIGQCHRVTDSCMATLSASLGHVENLDLRGCKHIRDSCICKIVRNCPRLRVLTLANCPSISDAAIKEIATYSGDVRVLDVCGCQKVTDQSIHTLANNCTRLMELDISSTGCTDKSVLLLADLCRWLERAKLSFLPDVTDQAVQKLIKNCPRLNVIHLFGCNKVNVVKLRTLNRFIKIEN